MPSGHAADAALHGMTHQPNTHAGAAPSGVQVTPASQSASELHATAHTSPLPIGSTQMSPEQPGPQGPKGSAGPDGRHSPAPVLVPVVPSLESPHASVAPATTAAMEPARNRAGGDRAMRKASERSCLDMGATPV